MSVIDRQDLLDQIEKQATDRCCTYRKRDEQPREADTEERRQYRCKLVRQNRALTNAISNERLIGRSDLLEINYLKRGLLASRAVCRIQIRNARGHVVGHGTGFMVSPRLLLTNQHVLRDDDEARRSLAEFNYEDDIFSRPKTPALFALAPTVFFEPDRALDFALVAVEPTALDGRTALGDFGYLKLRPESGKALIGEAVGIIQHPSGASKKIAVRANRVQGVLDDFIHYETDTEPGSSGAPVFSDEWEVVALHHAGVKARDDEGRVLNRDGGMWQPDEGEDAIQWRANEGVRISRVVQELVERMEALEESQRLLLREVVRKADVGSGPYIAAGTDGVEERRSGGWYEEGQGYDREFFGDEAVLDLPELRLAPQDARPPLLYRHFSIVMSRSRRQAIYTACNINGDLLVANARSVGWKTDPRLDDQDQLDDRFYRNQPGRENPLDRGHLVRRLDPSWDDIAVEAIDDTFHFTNAALQHRSFNNGIWGRLEDALLARADRRTSMTVFTGPILSLGDPVLRVPRDGGVDQAQVPLEFWKVIAFATDENFLAAAGFRQSQTDVLRSMNLDFTEPVERDIEAHIDTLLTYQVPIVDIENATGLSFHYLRDYDAVPEDLEAARPRVVRAADDIRVDASRAEPRRIGAVADPYPAGGLRNPARKTSTRKKPPARKPLHDTKR